jgi:hypothetical protein
MGTGKTMLAICTAHLHLKDKHDGAGYRVIVFCPGQLVRKWSREIRETIPDAQTTIINDGADLFQIEANAGERVVTKTVKGRTMKVSKWGKPTGPEWFIISRDRAKLGYRWEGVAFKRSFSIGRRQHHKHINCCPACGAPIFDKHENPVDQGWLDKKPQKCEGYRQLPDKDGKRVKCGEPLWQGLGAQQGSVDRFEPAKYIHKQMRGFFDMLVLDEAHEEKSDVSAQANAAGALGAAVPKSILLTGTLIGGYANHIRPLLFRFAPKSLVEEGLTWDEPTLFDKRYGRMQKTVYTTESTTGAGRNSRARESRRETLAVKPGIMPTLFGRHLLGNVVYLALDEVVKMKPPDEQVIAVDMDAEQRAEYTRIEQIMVATNKELLQKNNKCFLGAMLQTLLAYNNHPYGWPEKGVGYWLGDREQPKKAKMFIPVVYPEALSKATIRPKEAKLIEMIRQEKREGRQAWVYVQNTQTYDVVKRLETVLEQAGFRVGVLRASVAPIEREKWIEKQGRKVDVVLSHPKLVETGLDLFDRKGNHNYSTLIFYQTGYNLFTLRQASRRSWRIGQKLTCRIRYLFYAGTAEEAAMTLMGRKMQAALQLDGKLTAEGLSALAGDDSSVEMALARSLEKAIKDDAARAWEGLAAQTDEANAVEVTGDSELPDTEEYRADSKRRKVVELDSASDDVELDTFISSMDDLLGDMTFEDD